MRSLLCATAVLCFAVLFTVGQILPDNCPDGECCSALWFARQINLIWQGPIHFFDLDQCRDDPDNICNRDIGNNCGVTDGSDCQAQAECCWLNFWRTTQLTDDMGDGLSWGQYMCNAVNATNGPIGVLWEIDLQGRWFHCGGGRVWTWYPDIPPVNNFTLPTLCCRRNAVFDPNCTEE